MSRTGSTECNLPLLFIGRVPVISDVAFIFYCMWSHLFYFRRLGKAALLNCGILTNLCFDLLDIVLHYTQTKEQNKLMGTKKTNVHQPLPLPSMFISFCFVSKETILCLFIVNTIKISTKRERIRLFFSQGPLNHVCLFVTGASLKQLHRANAKALYRLQFKTISSSNTLNLQTDVGSDHDQTFLSEWIHTSEHDGNFITNNGVSVRRIKNAVCTRFNAHTRVLQKGLSLIGFLFTRLKGR